MMSADIILHNMDWVLPLRSEGATYAANAFTWLGYTTFFLIALPIAYWLWDRDRSTRLTTLIFITALVNGWLKDYWLDPRPDLKYALDPRVGDSFGRPSGHAQVAAVMWLWLAHELRRGWAWMAALIIVAGVCMSRLYLGVHDMDDVLTGLALGLASLSLFAWFLSPRFEFFRRLPAVAHLALIAAFLPLVFLIWPNGRDPSETAGVIFLFFGWMAGAALDRQLAPEAAPRPVWWKQAIMAAGGIIVLFALRAALGEAGKALALDAAVSAYGTTLILGFYMTGLAPLAFRALRLTNRSPIRAEAEGVSVSR